MNDTDLDALSQRIGAALQQAGLVLATAESCTGGGIAEVITRTAGSSAWFSCGFITYSNDAKMRQLDVKAETLRAHGAVSEATAAEMVHGALSRSRGDLALSVTGIAGPGGGTADKPVGTVCFGWCRRGEAPRTATQHFSGDRAAVRQQTIVFALKGLRL